MKTIGDVIKEYRDKHDLSLRDFSKLCGVSHSYIDRLEKGTDIRSGAKVEPTMDTITKIAKAMNLTIEEILKESGYINDNKSSNEVADNSEELTKRDLKNIEKDLAKMMEDMENDPSQGFAAYNGDNIDETDLELFQNALRDALIIAKKINKKKYTPKKYRKDDK